MSILERDTLARPDLKPTDKLIAAGLGIFADSKTRRAWPSVATLAKATALSDRTVQRGLKRLVDAGVLTRHTEKRAGQWLPVYQLHASPTGGDNLSPPSGSSTTLEGVTNEAEGVTNSHRGVTNEAGGGDRGVTRTTKGTSQGTTHLNDERSAASHPEGSAPTGAPRTARSERKAPGGHPEGDRAPAGIVAPSSNPGTPLGQILAAVRRHLYVPDGKPPKGWNEYRDADIAEDWLKRGRPVGEILEAVEGIALVRDAGDLEGWAPPVRRGDKLTLRILNRTRSGILPTWTLALSKLDERRKHAGTRPPGPAQSLAAAISNLRGAA